MSVASKPTWKPITAKELREKKKSGEIPQDATICPCCEWRLGKDGAFCGECQKAAAAAPAPSSRPVRPRSKSDRDKAAIAHLAESWPDKDRLPLAVSA